MKKLFTLLLVLSSGWMIARENVGKHKSVPTQKITSGCVTTTGTFDLDIANVRARIFTGGDMWWDLVGNPQYEVPKNSGKNSLFAGSIWIGGYDANNNLKVAAQTYRQGGGNDYWAGPVSTSTGTPDASATTCSAYDRFWNIYKADVLNFISGGAATPDMLSYPGNGNVANGELQFLAPFHDVNADGIYSSVGGDYPSFNTNGTMLCSNCNNMLHGDQCLWWVFNDVGNVKTETGSAALGLEIRAQAYAFNTSAYLQNVTFYQYQIVNRSSIALDSCYVGAWVDPDLGDYNDDYVGCDVPRGLGYCYNGDLDDGTGTAVGYGVKPPAIGLDFLQGPLADANDGIDNDFDNVIDEPCETVSMAKFLYYNNDFTVHGNPDSIDDYYQYLTGSWKNGDRWTHDGLNGWIQSFPVCNYIFPGNTDPQFPGSNWTEVGTTIPSDRRFLSSAGEFTMLPGQIQYVNTAVIWARDTVGTDNSVSALQTLDDLVQMAFDSCFSSTVLAIKNFHSINNVSVSPNPFSKQTTFHFPDAENSLQIFDTNGKIVFSNKKIKQKTFLFDRNNLKTGVYYYQIITAKNKKTSGKLIIK